MAIRCDRFGERGGRDYWLDAGGNVWSSPSQAVWPPVELAANGFPVGATFEGWAWQAQAFRDDVDPVLSAGVGDGADARAWESVSERLSGAQPGPTAGGTIRCRTRVSDRAGGQIYIISPKTNTEAVIPFTRYDDLGDLLERITGEFAEQTRDSRERKPWAVIEYTREDLKLIDSVAAQKRPARY